MTKLRRVAERAGRGPGSGVREKSRLRSYSASPPRAFGLLVAAILHPLGSGVLRVGLLVARDRASGLDLVLGELSGRTTTNVARCPTGTYRRPFPDRTLR